MELDDAIKSRRSVRRYSDKKPDWRQIIEAIDMARYSPMAGNLFSLRFILVNDENKISQIAQASQQDFIADAQYVVVVCSSTSRTLNSYSEKGDIYLRQQAGAGMQNFLLKLVELGLSTCWIGLFIEEDIKNILKIPDGVNVEALFPIGYESNIGKTKGSRRIDLDNVLYFEKYGQKKMPVKRRLIG